MTSTENRLKTDLNKLGLTKVAIDAAWPEWWSVDAESSPSARLELRFSLARKLGLDAQSLLDEEGVPRFAWRDEARFKNLSGETDLERSAIASFGRAVGSILVEASAAGARILTHSVSEIRSSILRTRPFVGLLDLLTVCWASGIPVIQLKVFPLARKRMVAMSVRIGNRDAILLGKESRYPAQAAFYVAHEMGHIALGHLRGDIAIVDLNEDDSTLPVSDEEEKEAEEFALRLLTGRAQPDVVSTSSEYNAPGLATAALQSAESYQIEAGTLALCFGYSSGNWPVANSALRFIYGHPRSIGTDVNNVAASQLDSERVPSDSAPFLNAVLGRALSS